MVSKRPHDYTLLCEVYRSVAVEYINSTDDRTLSGERAGPLNPERFWQKKEHEGLRPQVERFFTAGLLRM